MEIKDYAKDLQRKAEELLRSFVEKKQPLITTQRICISFSSSECSLIHLNQVSNSQIEILVNETFRYGDIDSLNFSLAALVKKYQLENIPTSLLLSPEDYQLFLIESFAVEQNELEDALKWRIRSLINYPIEEAVVDYFKIPAKKSAPNSPMLAAITAKSTQLDELSKLIEKCGLTLTVIDIPELALRNLTNLYENDEKSTAMIYIDENSAILNITREKTLYFTRRFNLIGADTREAHEKISLEILRYFDYYQSQWRHPSPQRVFVASMKKNSLALATALSELLLVSVLPYQLKIEIPDTAKLQLIENKYLLLLGGVLRGDTDVSPGN